MSVTALHWAAGRCYRAEGYLDVVAWLLGHGADPNASDSQGNTPLHRAMELRDRADPEVVQVLLDRGGDLSVRNHRGDTPCGVADADLRRLVCQ